MGSSIRLCRGLPSFSGHAHYTLVFWCCCLCSSPTIGCPFFFFQAEDGIRDLTVTGVQTCALPISLADLVVNGVQVTTFGDATVAPNTRITLPGVGYVVLNEQLPTGDGVHASGLTVNQIGRASCRERV